MKTLDLGTPVKNPIVTEADGSRKLRLQVNTMHKLSLDLIGSNDVSHDIYPVRAHIDLVAI